MAPGLFDTNQQLAYDTLRSGIIHAVYQPGVRLSMKSLGEDLGMSRTPIREALMRLQQEGLVESVPHSGTYVTYIDTHAARSALYVRKNLETAVAVECCSCSRASDLARIDETLVALAASVEDRDARRFFAWDSYFCRLLFDTVEKDEVWRWIDGLSVSLDRIRWLITTTEKLDWASVLSQHRAVRDAIARRDGAAACELESLYLNSMLEHEQTARERFGAYFAPRV